MPIKMNLLSLNPRTLEQACEEALHEAGFQYIVDAETNLTYSLWEYCDTTRNDGCEDKPVYVRFGNVIVRLGDAWCTNALVYELLY